MTTFSKLLSKQVAKLTCKDIFHPEFESCTAFFWFFLSSSTVQSLKYLAPIILVPAIIQFRQTNTKKWKEAVETYLKMSLGISGVLSFGVMLVCFLNKINRGIRYYNMTAVPSFVSMAILTSLNVLPTKFANIQFLFINNLLVQTIFRTSDYQTFQIVRESKLVSTLLFMTFSSLIMGLMAFTKQRGEKIHRYWYARYSEVRKSDTGNSEAGMIEKIHLLQELINKQIMSTMQVGLLMSSIKNISKSIKLLRKSIFKFVISFTRNFDYKLLGFFVMYGTSFQIFNFLLNELSDEKKQQRNSYLAGFLAGAAFYLSPRYSLFTFAFTTLIELLMVLFLNKSDQRSKVTKFLKKVPWLKVFVSISISTFTHWRIVRPWLIPKFVEEMLRITAIDRFGLGSQNYAKCVLGL